jgi:RNA polymerase sigma-70 factor (ECF subfamily)
MPLSCVERRKTKTKIGDPLASLGATGMIASAGRALCGGRQLDNVQARQQELDRFLVGVERRAYRLALIATRNREDALDIVQEAMLRLVRRYADRPGAEWGPLFQRIVQSTIRDWYRRSQVRSRWRQFLGKGLVNDGAEPDENPLETRFAGSEPEPDARLASQQAMETLDVALHQLPPRQQQVFLLRQWEGLSVKETATVMGCGEGSVKTHYSRAVRVLREKLAGHWPEITR